MQNELEEVLVFVLYKGDIEEFPIISVKIKSIVNEQFGFEVHHVIPINKMPKTTSGKIQRSALAKQYQSGEFNEITNQLARLKTNEQIAVADEHSDQYINSILQICKEALPDKLFTIHDNLLEIGASSLALVELHTALDEMYPEQIEITDLVEHPTISDLAKFLKEKEALAV